MAIARVNVGDVMHQMTLNVRITGVTALRVRVRVAAWLFRLATRVLGTKCSLRIEG